MIHQSKSDIQATIVSRLFNPLYSWINEESKDIVQNKPMYFRYKETEFCPANVYAPNARLFDVSHIPVERLDSLYYLYKQVREERKKIKQFLLPVFNKHANISEIINYLPVPLQLYFRDFSVPISTEIDDLVNTILTRNVLL